MTVCVNCGVEVLDEKGEEKREVYDEKLYKSTGIIKLIECTQCKDYVDKYIGNNISHIQLKGTRDVISGVI